MNTGNINYEKVLEDLRAQRDRLDVAIAAMEALVSGAPVAETRTASTAAEKIDGHPFLGLGTAAAAIRYLEMVQEPKSNSEIAAALLKGGIHSTSDKFGNTVYTALHRSDKAIRLGRKWSLKEWHPRARIQASKKTTVPASFLAPAPKPQEDEQD